MSDDYSIDNLNKFSLSGAGSEVETYKKELQHLLQKSKGSSYEQTLKKFVDSKFKQLEEPIGRPDHPIRIEKRINLASLSTSKYDNPQRSVLEDLRGKSQHPDGKSRIEQMAEPLERHAYKGPNIDYRNSTNHIGRQRPPPEYTSEQALSPTREQLKPFRNKSNDLSSSTIKPSTAATHNRAVSTSRLESRMFDNTARSSERLHINTSFNASTNSLFGPKKSLNSPKPRSQSPRGRNIADHDTAPTSPRHFRQWLQNNKAWERRVVHKIEQLAKEREAALTKKGQPKIYQKSVKLAEIANIRTAQKLMRKFAPANSDFQTTIGSAKITKKVIENELSTIKGTQPATSFEKVGNRATRRPSDTSVGSTATASCAAPTTEHIDVDDLLQKFPSKHTPKLQQRQQQTTHQIEAEYNGDADVDNTSTEGYNTNTDNNTVSDTSSYNPVQRQINRLVQPIDVSTNMTTLQHNTNTIERHPENIDFHDNNFHIDDDDINPRNLAYGNVYDRLAERAKLQAMRYREWTPPPVTRTFQPKITDHSRKLAERWREKRLQPQLAAVRGETLLTNVNTDQQLLRHRRASLTPEQLGNANVEQLLSPLSEQQNPAYRRKLLGRSYSLDTKSSRSRNNSIDYDVDYTRRLRSDVIEHRERRHSGRDDSRSVSSENRSLRNTSTTANNTAKSPEHSRVHRGRSRSAGRRYDNTFHRGKSSRSISPSKQLSTELRQLPVETRRKIIDEILRSLDGERDVILPEEAERSVSPDSFVRSNSATRQRQRFNQSKLLQQQQEELDEQQQLQQLQLQHRIADCGSPILVGGSILLSADGDVIGGLDSAHQSFVNNSSALHRGRSRRRAHPTRNHIGVDHADDRSVGSTTSTASSYTNNHHNRCRSLSSGAHHKVDLKSLTLQGVARFRSKSVARQQRELQQHCRQQLIAPELMEEVEHRIKLHKPNTLASMKTTQRLLRAKAGTTFAARNDAAVENHIVRKAVALRSPSPGPGHYSKIAPGTSPGGMLSPPPAVLKAESLSALHKSYAPGSKGFSFSRCSRDPDDFEHSRYVYYKVVGYDTNRGQHSPSAGKSGVDYTNTSSNNSVIKKVTNTNSPVNNNSNSHRYPQNQNNTNNDNQTTAGTSPRSTHLVRNVDLDRTNSTPTTNISTVTKSNAGIQQTASSSMVQSVPKSTKASISAGAPAGDPSGDPSDSGDFSASSRGAKKSKSNNTRRRSFFAP